jgi:hypothetical protein
MLLFDRRKQRHEGGRDHDENGSAAPERRSSVYSQRQGEAKILIKCFVGYLTESRWRCSNGLRPALRTKPQMHQVKVLSRMKAEGFPGTPRGGSYVDGSARLDFSRSLLLCSVVTDLSVSPTQRHYLASMCPQKPTRHVGTLEPPRSSARRHELYV